jgi:hypothetical protein
VKVIISHDVDHIKTREHNHDLIIPKLFVRSFLELCLGKIKLAEYVSRHINVFTDRLQNIDELIKFDKENGVPSVFFVAVNNGRNLNYSLKDAEFWIKKIRREGFEVGIHGIEVNNCAGICEEYELFKKFTNLDKFGIRMHDIGVKGRDVKLTQENLKYLDQVGYQFSSNTFEWRAPYRIGNLWNFPVHIMDVYVLIKQAKWQNQSLRQAQRETEALIKQGHINNLRYFSILFHDYYFNTGFSTWQNWYFWLIEFCRKNGFDFISYKNAILELEAEAASE